MCCVVFNDLYLVFTVHIHLSYLSLLCQCLFSSVNVLSCNKKIKKNKKQPLICEAVLV